MPNNKEQRERLNQQCEKLEVPCKNCCEANHVDEQRFSGTYIHCGVNASFKDVFSWVSVREAQRCPGPELRRLFLGAPLHYQEKKVPKPPDSS